MSKNVVYDRDSLTETIKGFGEQFIEMSEQLSDMCIKGRCLSIDFNANINPNELPVLTVEMIFANGKISCPMREVQSIYVDGTETDME